MTTVSIVDEETGRGRTGRFELELTGTEITAREIIRQRVLIEHGGQRPRGEGGGQPWDAASRRPLKDDPAPVSPESAVREALVAFEAGRFVLLVGDRQAETLDQPLTLGPDAEITFLRLTPLRGG